jgi:DNA sulfur modification protein DndB
MKYESLVLPALRGFFGDWIYYSCLMSIQEIGVRVRYAEEIHPDKALSQLIQRSLEGPRARHIASYLASTQERFFNSLVLATYGGSPEWLEVGNFRSTTKPELLQQISESAMDNMGFLSLTGSEKIFAIDGQHRLAGIRKAILDGLKLGEELVPILLVGHKKDAAGMQRIRRLFTTLNKTAISVRKRDIIALDEDDVMAIVARRLVETNPCFRDPKIAVISSQNVPASNRTCLTTITSLYDILKLLFKFEVGKNLDRGLRFNRPSDGRLNQHYQFATSYFSELGKTFKPVGEFFASESPGNITEKHRSEAGGHILFRPIGLDLFTQTAIDYAKSHHVELPQAVNNLKGFPTSLTQKPYRHVIWDPVRHTMMGRGKGLALGLLKYMMGLSIDRDDVAKKYASALHAAGIDEVNLPPQIV